MVHNTLVIMNDKSLPIMDHINPAIGTLLSNLKFVYDLKPRGMKRDIDNQPVTPNKRIYK